MIKRAIIILILYIPVIPVSGQVTLFDDTFEIMGEWTAVNGRWQIDGNKLVQLDSRDVITHCYRIVKQAGTMEYAFDLAFLGGMQDKYAGFGLHICIDRPAVMRSWGHNRSYLLWLTCDEAVYGQPGFFAQVYRSRGPTGMKFWLMQKGNEFPVPLEILDPARVLAGGSQAELRIRLIIDLKTGKGKFYHPRDGEYFFPIDFGTPLEGGMYISLRTNSLSVGIDNFRVVQVEE